MPDVHAVLSASASHRWLHCTPSAVLERQYPDEGSVYAEEGTKAHAMAEKRLKYFLENGKFLRKPRNADTEMWEATGEYVATCAEKILAARADTPDARVMVEERLDFSRWVPEGFGTGDMVIVSDDYIEVVDLKYGKGVEVSAEGNSQMRLYALGALAKYGGDYLFDRVRMTIIQPRIGNISTDEMSVEELEAWGESIIPIAAKAHAGAGERLAGDHCRFCKCRATCARLSEYLLKEVKTDMAAEDMLPEDIAEVLLKATAIKAWLTDVESYAMGRALSGDKLPGLKLVEGRSKRVITDADAAVELLTGAGYKSAEIMKPMELQTLTALEKLVGKKKLAELLADVIEKPQGKPCLVALSDKRPELEIAPVSEDFSDDLLKG